MPIMVEWDNEEKTITRMTIQGVFTFDELQAAGQSEHDLMATVQHAVYSLNVYDQVSISIRGLNVRQIRESSSVFSTPNLKMAVHVTTNPLIRNLLRTILISPPYETYVVSTLDEAYARIAEHQQQA